MSLETAKNQPAEVCRARRGGSHAWADVDGVMRCACGAEDHGEQQQLDMSKLRRS